MNSNENIEKKDKFTDYSFYALLGLMAIGALAMLGYLVIQMIG